MGERRRLVWHVGEADHERDLPDRVGELEAGREREGGVDAVREQEHLDRAGGHRLGQARHVPVRARLSEGRVGPEAYGPADRADRHGQQIDRRLRLSGVGPGRGDPAADGETRPAAGEGPGDAPDHLHAHARIPRGGLQVDPPDRLGERAVREAVLDHRLEDRQREHTLGAGRIPYPEVGVRRRQRLAGLDLDEQAGPPVPERMHVREGAAVLDRREPRLHEVGAEGEDRPGLLEGVVRNRVATKCQLVRRPDRLVREGLEGHARPGAERLEEGVHEATEAPGLELGDERDARALAAGGPEPGDERRLGRLPADGPAAEARAGEAVGMIEPLERGVAPQAERAATDGMVGVPLELGDAPVVVLGEGAAAGRALPADRRKVGGGAGDDLLVRHDLGEELLGRSAATTGGGRARGGHDPEEVSSLHQATLSPSRGRPGVGGGTGPA